MFSPKFRSGAVALGLLATIGVTACGGGSSSSSTTKATTATTAPSAASTTAAVGTTINIEVGETSADAMYLKPDVSTAKAGRVTFVVTNKGTKDHEVVVLKTDTPYDQLAIDPATNKVSEDANVAETGDPELKPGEKRTFSADLAAGNYVLVCNVEKHYGMGMRAPFTVTA